METALSILLSTVAFAGPGEGHVHGPSESTGPIVIILLLLVLGGAGFHFLTKKK